CAWPWRRPSVSVARTSCKRRPGNTRARRAVPRSLPPSRRNRRPRRGRGGRPRKGVRTGAGFCLPWGAGEGLIYERLPVLSSVRRERLTGTRPNRHPYFRSIWTLSSKENLMSQRLRTRFIPQLETLEDRAVPSTVQRPISDFLSQQGTTSVFNSALP